MAELRKGWYKAEKGKHFVLTEKGKQEVASYKNKEIGKPVSQYDTEACCSDVECGYVTEVPIENWIVKEGWEVVYDHNGYTIHVGNPIVFPEKELAEKYLKNYQDKAWVNKTLYVKPGVFEGIQPQECSYHEGKKVYNLDWYFGIDSLLVGDLVEDHVVEDLVSILPPTYYGHGYAQLGEPYSHECDNEGIMRATYATFKQIAESIWEYCGNCFAGKSEAVKVAA